jgi:DNA mismatch repair protein PMS2
LLLNFGGELCSRPLFSQDALEAHFSQHRATFDVATQSGKTQNSSKDTTSSSDIAGGFDDHESDGDMIAVDGNGGVTEEIWDTGHDKVHSRPVESSLVPDGMEIDFPQSSGNSAGKATSAEATSAESLSPLSCRSAGPVAIEPVRPSAASGPDPSPTAAKGTLGYQRASLRFSSTSVGRSSPVETFSHSTREFIEQAESISVQRPDVPDSDHSLPGPASTLGDSSSPRHAGAKTNSSVLGDSDPEEERPLKKRRSETGGVSTHGDRASSMSSTPAHGMPHDKASDRMVPRRNASHGLKATRSLPEREPSSRQKLRHSIMAFARPGTQVIDLDENEDDDSDPEPDNPITQASHDYLDAQSADEATGAQRMDRSSPKKATVKPGVKAFDLSGDDDDIPEVSSDLGPSSDMESALPSTSEPVEPASRPEIVSTRSGEHAIIRFDLSRVVGKWQSLQASSSTSATMKEQSHSGDALPAIDEHASLANVSDNAKAADALSRVIEKQDFATMDVIGQFNKGFILVRRRKPIGTHGDGVQGRVNDDLFIVDQHAADEKYNFESLQLTTKIDSQKLFQFVCDLAFPSWLLMRNIRPQYLELTAADELIAVDNLDVLRQNGFEVEVDEEGSEENRPRLRLLAQPVSKSTVFDMKGEQTTVQAWLLVADVHARS